MAPCCRAHAQPHAAPLRIPTLQRPRAAPCCCAPAQPSLLRPCAAPRHCAPAQPTLPRPCAAPRCCTPAQPHAAPLGSHIHHLCAAPRCCDPVQPHTAPKRQTLYPTAGAEGAAKSILRRVGDCVSGCAEAGEFGAEDPKSNPGGMPLASLSQREAPGVLGTGGRPRGLRSEMSDV